MKKVLWVVIPILLIAIGAGVYFGVIADSPELALAQIAKDVDESGIDGLMPHLTDSAKLTVSAINTLGDTIGDNKTVDTILSFLGQEDYSEIIASNLKEIDWKLEDITKSDESADVVLRFDYSGKLNGTIDFTMTKVDGEWKISKLDLPKVSQINFDE